MDIITWLCVGLVAVLLASFVSKGGGFGLIGDILLPGVIFVAFVGAVVVLFAIRLVQRTRTRA